MKGRADRSRARSPALQFWSHGDLAVGFTLIEVLVGLAIFAGAAVVLGATYVNVISSYDAVARRNEHEQDLAFVRAAILGESDRKTVEQGGDFALPDNRTAHWEAKVEEATVADLFRVSFHCELRDPARAQPWVRDETFMLLRPTWSDPATRDKLRQDTRDRLTQGRSQ
jgi:general secretion pathway protein I